MAKKSVKPAPPERPTKFTTDKGRAVIFFERAVFPLRDAPPAELFKAWEKLGKLTAMPDHHWKEVGPLNIAGRVTSLVISPANDQLLFAATAGGGVWRSRNAGDDWEYCWRRTYSHNVGSLSVMRGANNNTRLLAGTGEANLSVDTYSGSGVYFSDDSGETWAPFFTPPPGMTIPLEQALSIIPGRIGSIAHDPFGVLHGALGSVSLDERMQAGLYLLTIDMGLIPCEAFPLRSYNCHSVLFHPTERGLMFAALELRGSQNGIWRSENSGKDWVQLTRGLPAGEKFGRITLAMAPSNPDIMYALAANRKRGLLGVYRSLHRGDSWRQLIHEEYPSERSISYNNTIAVHPKDPDFVVWGGQRLYRTTNGGKKWQPITSFDAFAKARRDYVHEDHHAVIITPEGNIYSGNDGGVAFSRDRGETWTERSKNMVTTMFYDVDVASESSKIMGGGAQDNGTLILGLESDPRMAIQPLRGDGGWIVFDGANHENVFASFQNVNILHHKPRKGWSTENWDEVIPAGMSNEERSQRAIAVMAIEPGTWKGKKKVWVGTNRLWRTVDEGETWEHASPIFDGSVISAIEVASFNSRIIFVGTTRGALHRSRDGGQTWSEDIGGIDMPRRLISRIETHPRKPSTVAVCTASTGLHGAILKHSIGSTTTVFENVQSPQPFQKVFSNIFLSEDTGDTWKDIDEGRLPNVVFYALAFETRPPFRLFAAGDAGVFVLEDKDWVPISGNMPNVVVSDLVYHHKDQILTAATYGRGIWQLDVAKLKAGLPGRKTLARMIPAQARDEWKVGAPPQTPPAPMADN